MQKLLFYFKISSMLKTENMNQMYYSINHKGKPPITIITNAISESLYFAVEPYIRSRDIGYIYIYSKH